jgi:hypothetical protein
MVTMSKRRYFMFGLAAYTVGFFLGFHAAIRSLSAAILP